MSYCVLDTEVTIRNCGEDAVGDLMASPHHPDNFIVAVGFKYSNGFYRYDYRYTGTVSIDAVIPSTNMLVLQNAAFDVQWLLRADIYTFMDRLRDGVCIWDCQIAEYILTGQAHQYASLDEMALKYGGTQKDNRIAAYWDAGIDTTHIPEAELLEYLKHDVENTEKVFLAQLETAQRLKLLPLLKIAMEDRLATILMEWNGMCFSKSTAKNSAELLHIELTQHRNEIAELVKRGKLFGEHTEFNPASSQHVCKVLFGGTADYFEDAPVRNADGSAVVHYKTGARAGQIKTKKTKVTEQIRGFDIKPKEQWKLEGWYSTADDVLTELLSMTTTSPEALQFIEGVLECRAIAKDISTYYKGYSKLTWPTDGCIHPSINHCATDTGRQSCTKPNLQNASREDT